jgi:hypothetical protein
MKRVAAAAAALQYAFSHLHLSHLSAGEHSYVQGAGLRAALTPARCTLSFIPSKLLLKWNVWYSMYKSTYVYHKLLLLPLFCSRKCLLVGAEHTCGLYWRHTHTPCLSAGVCMSVCEELSPSCKGCNCTEERKREPRKSLLFVHRTGPLPAPAPSPRPPGRSGTCRVPSLCRSREGWGGRLCAEGKAVQGQHLSSVARLLRPDRAPVPYRPGYRLSSALGCGPVDTTDLPVLS